MLFFLLDLTEFEGRLTNDPLATVEAVEVTCFSTPTSNQLETKLNYDSAVVLPFSFADSTRFLVTYES
jgi:hypothetical protein